MSSDSGNNIVTGGDEKMAFKQQQQQQRQQQEKSTTATQQKQIKTAAASATTNESTVLGYQSSGMTPSIVTTINNADPNKPLANYPSIVNSNYQQNGKNSRRTNEQYESYIEDSFVGHWEHEDDDVDEYQEDFDAGSPVRCDDDNANLQHPSTIEFDFDSFGPESFIYTPSSATLSNINNNNNDDSAIEKPLAVLATTEPPSANINEGQTTSNSTITSPDSLLSNTISRPQTLVEASQEIEKVEQRSSEDKRGDTASTTTANVIDVQAQPGESNDSQVRQLQYNRNLKPQYDLIDPTQIDMKVIEPYKKVISHAGYCHIFDPSAPAPDPNEPAPAVIVFSACYLPDRSRRDYNYVMDHLFLYVLTSLHELIADDYILIYLHNTRSGDQVSGSKAPNATNCNLNSSSASSPAASSTVDSSQQHNNLPTFSWMKRCYQMIDRRLRKNLRILYLVKPTFWLKTIVIMCKPFISAKFSKKLRFVEDMNGLKKCIPVDKLILPASADYI